MAIYLGGYNIPSVKLGGYEVKEIYLGGYKVWPDKPEDLLIKVIFTDANGDTYDRLAFKNKSTGEIKTPTLRINGLLEGYYVGNSLVDDSITEKFSTINEVLQKADIIVYFYPICSSNESTGNIENSLGQVRDNVKGTHLYQFINSGTDTEVDIEDTEYGSSVDYPSSSIYVSSEYELVGRKNGTGDIITICDGEEVRSNNISLSKFTIQNNILRVYYNFKGTPPEGGDSYEPVNPTQYALSTIYFNNRTKIVGYDDGHAYPNLSDMSTLDLVFEDTKSGDHFTVIPTVGSSAAGRGYICNQYLEDGNQYKIYLKDIDNSLIYLCTIQVDETTTLFGSVTYSISTIEVTNPITDREDLCFYLVSEFSTDITGDRQENLNSINITSVSYVSLTGKTFGISINYE